MSQTTPETANTHVIVIGNEKGGSGKTTVAMHLAVALMKSGASVGGIDLDLRQKSFWRYLENRAKWGVANNVALEELPIPKFVRVSGSNHDSRGHARQSETAEFKAALMEFAACDFLIVDTPGADTHLSRLAHMHADTIVTPLNDSLVDFDMLGRVDPVTRDLAGPSLYAELVWSARQQRAAAGARGGIDWVVMRNRVQATNAKNKVAMGELLDTLSKRIQFRHLRGLGERVIYRELFANGLTLFDLGIAGAPRKFGSMSHLAARSEVRSFLTALNLPTVARAEEAA